MSVHLTLTDDTQISHCPKLAITLDSRNSQNFTGSTVCPRGGQLFMMVRLYSGAEVTTSWEDHCPLNQWLLWITLQNQVHWLGRKWRARKGWDTGSRQKSNSKGLKATPSLRIKVSEFNWKLQYCDRRPLSSSIDSIQPGYWTDWIPGVRDSPLGS